MQYFLLSYYNLILKFIFVGLDLGEAENSKLHSSAEDTGLLCLFLDKLFDSVNGSTISPPPGKILRCAVTHLHTGTSRMRHNARLKP